MTETARPSRVSVDANGHAALSVAPRHVSISKGDLIRFGADWLADFVLKAAADDRAVLDRLCHAAREQAPAAQLQPAPPAKDESLMVGEAPQMQAAFDAIRRFAPTDLPVLITGESGTGKELAARAIHDRSPFASGPFVAVNTGGLPPTLIASELFGHERGAYTGATERRIGQIEQANRGTLFLDEIGEMPMELQVHLLRFLQERTIQRVGGSGAIKVNVRVIAATNVDLEQAVANGHFRQDLFFRLDVLRLHLPPLRERGTDVELLAGYWVSRTASELGRAPPQIDPEALAAIGRHAWPGNVRELISRIRRAVLMGDGRVASMRDLGLDGAAKSPPSPARDEALTNARNVAEAEALTRALRASGYNITRAARGLGVSRVTIYNLMRKHGLSRDHLPIV